MKKGDQFYLEFQIVDNNGNILTNVDVDKIVFYIANLKRTYTPNGDEVTYDSEKKCYKVWLTEQETLGFDLIDIDARILFNNGQIMGCYKDKIYFNDILVSESIL